jgi:hypothetical protein
MLLKLAISLFGASWDVQFYKSVMYVAIIQLIVSSLDLGINNIAFRVSVFVILLLTIITTLLNRHTLE